MKKTCVTTLILLLSLGMLSSCGLFAAESTEKQSVSPENYLRIHVRADSDDFSDQQVKYLVKDAVVRYLSPVLQSVKNKAEALSLVRAKSREIDAVASAVLSENGFSYTAKTHVGRENFPTRTYETVTLPAGQYDAVIVNLGSGKGSNWWCVVYPPLCFTAEKGTENGDTSDGFEYRSRIVDFWNEHFKG